MKKTIGIALALVAVLALAFVGYRYLSTHREGAVSSPDGVQEIVPMTDAAETAPDTARLETGETAEVYPAPDFIAYTLTGEAVRLSDYAGKPVVINFWATWCPPCRQELPGFENAWQQYGDDVVFLMVECGGESVDEVETFIAEGGYTFPVYVDSDGSGAAAYGINAIPVTALVDAEGNLFAYQVGAVEEDSLRGAIDLLLNA